MTTLEIRSHPLLSAPCALCEGGHVRTLERPALALFVAGTDQAVCFRCGAKHAPDLAAEVLAATAQALEATTLDLGQATDALDTGAEVLDALGDELGKGRRRREARRSRRTASESRGQAESNRAELPELRAAVREAKELSELDPETWREYLSATGQDWTPDTLDTEDGT